MLNEGHGESETRGNGDKEIGRYDDSETQRKDKQLCRETEKGRIGELQILCLRKLELIKT